MAHFVAQGEPEPSAREAATAMAGFEGSIAWQEGAVSLRDRAVVLSLAPGDRWAPPADASKILEAWGNPPDPNTDGLILPASAHLFGPASRAVLLSFQEDGWVDDTDAAAIDYDELLTDLQAAEVSANVDRRAGGLEEITLVGWAEPPRYDAATPHPVLREALEVYLRRPERELRRPGARAGRRPVDERDRRRGGPRAREGGDGAHAAFQAGHTYADYVPGVDEKAVYGIGALVAGGALAAKTGLFKGLLVALLASKKLIIAGVVAALAGGRVLWSRVFGSAKAD